MLRGESIVCISAIDWDFVWQSQQEIMRRLADAGDRVLYVENMGARTPGLRDARRVVHRAVNWSRGGHRGRVAASGIRVHSPVIIPLPYSPVARLVNRWILRRTLVPVARALGPAPILWIFLPTPLALDIAAMLRPKLVIYHRIDDLVASSPAASAMAASERALIEQADLVFATSHALQERALRYRPDVHRIPPGVSLAAFTAPTPGPPPDLAAIPRPRALYVGGIHKWMDFDLLAGVARAAPDIHIVLVGPFQTAAPGLHLPNVHFLGRKPHAELPAYIGSAEAALIPYRQSRYVDSVYPNKLNEYLATGVPVVGTPIPELVHFERERPGTLRLAEDVPAFVAALRDAAAESDPAARARRVAAAAESDWPRRLEQMSALIEAALARRTRP
jgi:glycosyltransferase involved in cell wall biosynthesis